MQRVLFGARIVVAAVFEKHVNIVEDEAVVFGREQSLDLSKSCVHQEAFVEYHTGLL